jgi:hypothetical protein
MGGPDDDLGTQGGDAHLHAGIAILGELPGEKLIELGKEHTICYELALLAHLSCHAGRRGMQQSFAAALEGLVETRAIKRKCKKASQLDPYPRELPEGDRRCAQTLLALCKAERACCWGAKVGMKASDEKRLPEVVICGKQEPFGEIAPERRSASQPQQVQGSTDESASSCVSKHHRKKICRSTCAEPLRTRILVRAGDDGAGKAKH